MTDDCALLNFDCGQSWLTRLHACLADQLPAGAEQYLSEAAVEDSWDARQPLSRITDLNPLFDATRLKARKAHRRPAPDGSHLLASEPSSPSEAEPIAIYLGHLLKWRFSCPPYPHRDHLHERRLPESRRLRRNGKY